MSSSTSSSEAYSATAARTTTSGPFRFVVSLLATVTFGLAALWIVTATMREGFLEPEFAIWQAKHQMLAQCHTAGTVVLGDSRASSGFIPGIIPDSVNYGLGGGSAIDSYFVTRTLAGCPVVPKRVLLSVSIEHLTGSGSFWQRSALFGFLSFDDIEEVRRESRALGDTSIFSAPTFGDVDAIIGDWLWSHRFPSFYSSSLLRGGVIGRLGMNRRIGAETLQGLGQHLYGTANGSAELGDEAALRSFQVPAIDDYYLRRTLAMLAEHGTQVDFVAVPMNDATYAALSPEVAQGYRDYIASLARQAPNLRIVGDSMPHWENKWFGDHAHLNAAGAKRFSTQVAAAIASAAIP